MITLLPYAKHNGVPTLLDSDILAIYSRMIADGTGYIFHDGSIGDQYDFLKMVHDKGTFFYVVTVGNEMSAIVWINRIEKKQGRIHFCAFKNIWGRAIGVGRESIRQLLFKKCDGDYCFDIFWGFTPSSNKMALMSLIRLGCKIAGDVPNIIWDESAQETKPGKLVYITREVFNENL